MSRATRIAVIGGGAAGLTAAHELAAQGVGVVVYEAEEWVGGRTRTDRLDGYRVDAGAQLFASMFTRVLALAREVGLADRIVRSPGRDAIWRGGRAHEVVYGSPASMLATGGLPLSTKLRLGATYLPFLKRHGQDLDLARPERAAAVGLDGESIAEWGEREMGGDFVERLVYSQLSAYYGALPEETSAALYHILARQGVDVELYALRGGASLLCEALAARMADAGGELRLGRRVEAVTVAGRRVSITEGGRVEEFDGVVMAAPAAEARTLLRDGADPDLREWLGGVRARPALSVGLLLDRPVGVRYFGLSLPRDESTTVAGICVEENKGAELVPDGAGALVVIVRPDVAPDLVDAGAREVVDAVLPDVRRAFPAVESTLRRARVYRWPAGNPVVYPGYLSHLEAFRGGGVEKDGPVALAGDYLYTPSVEGAVTSGSAAARRLLARIRPPDRPPPV